MLENRRSLDKFRQISPLRDIKTQLQTLSTTLNLFGYDFPLIDGLFIVYKERQNDSHVVDGLMASWIFAYQTYIYVLAKNQFFLASIRSMIYYNTQVFISFLTVPLYVSFPSLFCNIDCNPFWVVD